MTTYQGGVKSWVQLLFHLGKVLEIHLSRGHPVAEHNFCVAIGQRLWYKLSPTLGNVQPRLFAQDCQPCLKRSDSPLGYPSFVHSTANEHQLWSVQSFHQPRHVSSTQRRLFVGNHLVHMGKPWR